MSLPFFDMRCFNLLISSILEYEVADKVESIHGKIQEGRQKHAQVHYGNTDYGVSSSGIQN